MEKVKRKYVSRDKALNKKRIARCGHETKEMRYFKCENCVPELPSDDGEDWNYFMSPEDEE